MSDLLTTCLWDLRAQYETELRELTALQRLVEELRSGELPSPTVASDFQSRFRCLEQTQDTITALLEDIRAAARNLLEPPAG